MIKSRHATTQEAWEWINEFLATQEVRVIKNGGMRSGPQVISYDHFMEVNKAWVDPEFDFGFIFGYKIQKWTKLITNYIDMNMLDLVKSEVLERERKKTQNYNLTFKFSNTHSSGHGCLISATFQRRHKQDNPIVIVNIRSSEVTKRLLMDFLLVQRMTEYIYGEDVSASVKLFCGNMYLTAENFVMYHNHKPLETILVGDSGMEERVWAIYNKFMKPEALNIKYKVHLRSVKRLHKLPNPPLKAKDLNL
jgi:hypothetical protein